MEDFSLLRKKKLQLLNVKASNDLHTTEEKRSLCRLRELMTALFVSLKSYVSRTGKKKRGSVGRLITF